MDRFTYWILLVVNILLMTLFYLIHTYIFQGRILVIIPIIVLGIFMLMKECELEPRRTSKQGSNNEKK